MPQEYTPILLQYLTPRIHKPFYTTGELALGVHHITSFLAR